MKRWCAFFLILIISLSGGCRQAVPYRDPSLFALAVSDLHYTSDPNVISTVVPAMPYAPQAVEALVREVIAVKPDVFLITGDNTNSGRESDMRELAAYLKQIQDAGIPVVMVPGNHDFNISGAETYQEIYEPVLTMDAKDPSSLSYYTDIGNVRIFAMDDSSYTAGGKGVFREETMRWLRRNLNQAMQDGLRVLFLSHHNVTAGKDDERNESYRIGNANLESLLQKEQVRLILSGHLHSQAILESGGMYEIIEGMFLSGNHTLGYLTLNAEGIQYETTPVDFELYGEAGLAAAVAEADRKGASRLDDVFREIIQKKGYTAKETEGILDLLHRIFAANTNGTLSEGKDSITADPYYEAMRDALAEENYGPWIDSLLRNPPRNGGYLKVPWED